MIIHKFDPNPILVNINKLKPYQFQNTTTSKWLESIVERGRVITNIEIGFNTTTLENAEGTSTKLSFSVDGIKSKSHDLESKFVA